MTNMDPVMEPIFTKMIPCPGVGILKMIPCSAVRLRTEKYTSTPPPRDFRPPEEDFPVYQRKTAQEEDIPVCSSLREKDIAVYQRKMSILLEEDILVDRRKAL